MRSRVSRQGANQSPVSDGKSTLADAISELVVGTYARASVAAHDRKRLCRRMLGDSTSAISPRPGRIVVPSAARRVRALFPA